MKARRETWIKPWGQQREERACMRESWAPDPWWPLSKQDMRRSGWGGGSLVGVLKVDGGDIDTAKSLGEGIWYVKNSKRRHRRTLVLWHLRLVVFMSLFGSLVYKMLFIFKPLSLHKTAICILNHRKIDPNLSCGSPQVFQSCKETLVCFSD